MAAVADKAIWTAQIHPTTKDGPQSPFVRFTANGTVDIRKKARKSHAADQRKYHESKPAAGASHELKPQKSRQRTVRFLAPPKQRVLPAHHDRRAESSHQQVEVQPPLNIQRKPKPAVGTSRSTRPKQRSNTDCDVVVDSLDKEDHSTATDSTGKRRSSTAVRKSKRALNDVTHVKASLKARNQQASPGNSNSSTKRDATSRVNEPAKVSSAAKLKKQVLGLNIECLTCATEKPPNRIAILDCGHAMCHSCLKRLFTLSLTDPQHMPPRCCTAHHIRLKHVTKLLDHSFKVKWNHRYLEYTTNNRLYCPTRGCGAWIPSRNIRQSKKHPKRAIAMCKKCSTRICASCGQKWHIRPDCDASIKDSDNHDFAELAAARGWKTCYNCKATVELKEGCNHMVCRCGAQFCMVCGSKWKSCNCPWFNHDAVLAADELLDQPAETAGDRRAEVRALDAVLVRRQQERRDHALARRMQGLEIDRLQGGQPASATGRVGSDWTGNDTFGFGNASGHFLNDDFVMRATRILATAVSPETRAAAERLVEEIRADRAPPLPSTAFVGLDDITFEPTSRQDSVNLLNPFLYQQDAGEDVGSFEHAGSQKQGSQRPSHARKVASDDQGTKKSDGDARTRRKSILAGLPAPTSVGRVQRWVQHVGGKVK